MADNKVKGVSEESYVGLWIVIALVAVGVVIFGFSQPFDPKFINIEYFFNRVASGAFPFFEALTSRHTWIVVGIVSSVLSIIFIGIIVFSLVRMREIQIADKEDVEHGIQEAMKRKAMTVDKENPRWKYVLSLVESSSPSDWRIAIIEADSMLEELLEERGYAGDTLSEKLKDASFVNVDSAWEAHKVRNEVAHKGIDFPLSQIETRRTMRLYENVFEEFNVI